MAAPNFELLGAASLRTALRQAGDRARQSGGKALYREAEETMRDSKEIVPVDQGVLRNSGFVMPPEVTGNEVVVTLGYGGAASGYAIYLHEGTGPAVGRPTFMPPVSALKDWARRVLGDEGAAFAVARSIGMRGLRPRKFLEIPMKNRAGSMAGRLARWIRSDLGS